MFQQLKLTFVLILSMSFCLESHASSDMCSICRCWNSQANIDCSSRYLTSIPQPIPPNVELLDLSSNDILEINEEAFQNLSSLKTLLLAKNNIDKIQVGTFDDLPSLIDLDLRGNKIKEIKVETFRNLSTLIQLDLSSNDILEINEEAFQNLSSLKTLDLMKNNIKTIPVGTFDDFPGLSFLYLSGNSIKEIKVETFRNLSSLTELYLNENDIETIQVGTFDDLLSLRALLLSENKLKEIKGETFRYLSNLTTLYLDGNEMKEISGELFQYLSGLKTLYLDNSNMMYIQPGVFENLPNLEKLYLGGNNIKKIQIGSFDNLRNLKCLSFVSNGIQISENGAFLFLPRIIYIDFSNNRDMMCGCHLPALVNYVKTKFKRHMKVEGKCQADIGNNQTKVIPIMEYSQCKNYSLFQRNLLCQTCSGMKCNESEVTHCTGDEPVCQFKLSMDGIKLKFEKSCSTFRKCDDAMKNNTLTCNELTSGSTCVACCIGNLCNKKDFRGWSNSFVFPLISSSTFKFNESEGLAENISRAMEHELSNLTGNFEVQYCGYDDREAFTITCTVPRTITKDQIFKQISEILKTSQILRDLGLQHRNMELFDEMLCNENTTSINGTFHWPMTKIGTNVTIPCHANVATRYCSSGKMEYSEMSTSQYVKSPKCSPFTGVWKEPDMSQCYNTEGITQQLENITSEDINEENVEEISTIVRDISKKAKYFKAEDIDLAVDIQEKMVPLISNVSANITLNNILPSINDMIDTPEEILMEAEQSGGTGSRMLDIIEAIPEEIPLEGQQLAALYSNLGIGAIKVEKDTFNGAVFGISFGNNETEAKAMIHNNSDTSPQAKMSIDFISLPRVLLSRLNSNERSNVSRITFLSLKDDKLYRVKQNSSAKANTTIISNIIAANVPNVQIMDLDQPVSISVGLTEKNPGNLRCVYWDETLGQEPHWSTKGCNTSTYVPGEKMICSCDHLTSFAVLMEIYAIPAHGNISHLLYKTSYIGCGISLACLLLTVIFYVCSKCLRKLMPSKILINMCISLAITNVIFLAGMRPYDSEKAACKAVAALLHFFILTSLMWTAVEALHIFVRMPSFMIKSSIVAWGLPAVIVAITLAINHTNNYIRIADVCWLSKVSFYVAFLAPVVAILLFNFIVIFLAICRRSSKKSDEQSEHEIKKMRVFGIFSVTFLFVLSWVIAFIAEEEGVGVFHILFIIFNILLGMFIFIFYCIYKKDARDAISSYAMRANKSSRSSNKTDVGTVEKRT